MKSYPFYLFALLVTIHSSGFGQKKLKKSDRTIVSNMQAHVNFLGGENLKGRKAGSPGEKMAGEYIVKQFSKSGLKPRGDSSSWYQAFEIYDGKEVMPSSELSINGQGLKLHKDYFPFAFSANKNAEAAVAIALAENGVPWFKDVGEMIDDDDSAHVDTFNIIRTKASNAANKGATALIIYNKSDKKDLEFNKYDSSVPSAIPVLYINKGAFKKYCSDESAILDVKLNVELDSRKRTGNNVIGYADNGGDSTIIAAAHLDNETDVAALIEVARLMKNASHKKAKNYLFIVYSGEQKGLPGMNYFRDHPSINLNKVNYTIDLDTVRIENENPKGLNLVKRSVEIIKNK